MSDILNKYKEPKSIPQMSITDLNLLSKEIREFLIENVSKTGGHLASNLGVVELTISLYNVFDFEKDKLIWDVGHQAYVHKILTGRKDKFETLKKFGGMSGFPKNEESKFDMFQTGHSSTSISAALGMAAARDLKGEDHHVVAVIGDGALTGGMAFEALNDVGYRKTKIIIILNDNQMSIAKNVGGISTYLSRLRLDPSYNKLKNEFNTTLEKSTIGKGVVNSINKVKDMIKQVFVPGMLFEEMGLKYLGPIDGHNIKDMSKVLSMAKNIDGPVIIHTITQKGKGYNFAEMYPHKFHSVGPFDCDSSEICFTSGETYSSTFGDEIVKIADENDKVVAITAAMTDGTGLTKFSQKYNKRFFDVGIAEQHAVTLAAGMAKEGYRPIFAVYSTFLQRGYDQVLHDVCIQNLPVIFAIDRAGLVGEDGETHQGIFDISYLSHIPNMTIMAPKCMDELRFMLRWAVTQKYPIAIRYPRGNDDLRFSLSPIKDFRLGSWECLYEGGNLAIIATGKMVSRALAVREKLLKQGIETTVVNACFIKPIDKTLINKLAEKKYKIVTLEDNVLHGGLGTLILEYVNSLHRNTTVLNLGFNDKFVQHGSVEILYKLHSLDEEGIVQSILKL